MPDEPDRPTSSTHGSAQRRPTDVALRDLLERALDFGIASAEIAALISRDAGAGARQPGAAQSSDRPSKLLRSPKR
jgi:hypothetical protein